MTIAITRDIKPQLWHSGQMRSSLAEMIVKFYHIDTATQNQY